MLLTDQFAFHTLFDATITGTSGDDRLDGSNASEYIQGLAGDDVLQGFGGADWLAGGAGDDTLLGGSGNDTLNGGTGSNSLNGGSGDDMIVVADPLTAQVDGGSGWDTVSFHLADNGVTGAGYLGVEELIGSAFGDELELVGGGAVYGGAGDDQIFGSFGTEATAVRGHGQSGDDTLYVGSAADTLSGNGGDDTLSSDPSASVLAVLKGGKGDDSFLVYGGDTIDGGAGDDVVSMFGNGSVIAGGGGADEFIVSMSYHPELGLSLITDLTNQDRIVLDQYDGQHFTLVDHFDGHGHEARLVYDAGADETQLQLDVNGDKAVDVAVRISGDHTDFTNFVL